MEQTCGLSECALWYVLKFIMIISHELNNFIYLCCCCSTSLLLDPLEAKCGHFFCWGCITELLISSTDEQAHLCGVCQSMACKNDMKELSPKTSKLTSTLQHFKQVFCQAEGWRIGIIIFYQTLKLFKFVHIMYWNPMDYLLATCFMFKFRI